VIIIGDLDGNYPEFGFNITPIAPSRGCGLAFVSARTIWFAI